MWVPDAKVSALNIEAPPVQVHSLGGKIPGSNQNERSAKRHIVSGAKNEAEPVSVPSPRIEVPRDSALSCFPRGRSGFLARGVRGRACSDGYGFPRAKRQPASGGPRGSRPDVLSLHCRNNRGGAPTYPAFTGGDAFNG